VSYGDVLFKKYIPEALVEQEEPLVVVVDSNWRTSGSSSAGDRGAGHRRLADYVRCTHPGTARQNYFLGVHLQEVSEDLPEDQIDGEWMGLWKISPEWVPVVHEVLRTLLADEANRTQKVPLLINELVRQGHPIRVLYMSGQWIDVDSLEDVVHAAGVFR
jgi:phosphoenolpyruvate phosphomutase